MRELSIREARAGLSKIEELLKQEKELVITRRGKAVAKIVSLGRGEVPSHASLRREIGPLSRSSEELIREDRGRG